ncbi:MAG TPA: transposase [Verrucomicrobiae bacterium]|nr:transposase [Verrucomicrobiae bacterium]
MARALRIERPGGRYHVTARGNERKDIFRDDSDHFHFLELLSQLGERYGARVHAYVLMSNHYHLLLETPEANLSRAMHWLNASYCVWFNRRHRRCGHLLQGRFGAFVVEDDAGWQEVARYVHLNPVRVAGMGPGKAARAASRAGLAQGPSPEQMAERLRVLREYRWSSYPGYAGYRAPLDWVWRDPLQRLCGGRTPQEQCAAIRSYTEEGVRQGGVEPPWGRVVEGSALGSPAFAQRLRSGARGDRREQKSVRDEPRPASWAEIISAVERAKGESWRDFADRHGDWGRDAALWLGRRAGRLRLAQLGHLAGGLDYAVVRKALARFGQRLGLDDSLRQQLTSLQNDLSK